MKETLLKSGYQIDLLWRKKSSNKNEEIWLYMLLFNGREKPDIQGQNYIG